MGGEQTLGGLIGQRLKGRVTGAIGPHGLNIKYQVLYTEAASHIGRWLKGHATSRELCAAIGANQPVLYAALAEISDESLELMRYAVRHDLTDLGPKDIEQILRRVVKQAPLHGAVLTATTADPCPYCDSAHLDWAREQLLAVLAGLRADPQAPDGTPGG